MPTFWAVALTFALFSVYIETADLQKTQVGDAAKDLVASASTTKNETKKEDKLTKILPLVTFDCTGRTEGYYADVQFDCEAFHYCKASGERFTFVCPPKSRFNQKHMICDYDRYGLKLCYTAEKYFKLNENLYPKTEDEKANNDASSTIVKSQEKKKVASVKNVKNEASIKEETKPIKPQNNKAKKLEKTYIVTEYYDHDLPTTEQPLIDDASPKVYNWYTPPVTSDTPLDEVEYDDSIRHQYEYPDDYPDGPYYDQHEDHSKEKAVDTYSHGKGKKSYNYNEHDQKKSNKDKSNTKTSSEDKSHRKIKQKYEEPNTKQTQSSNNRYSDPQKDRFYENSNTKEVSHSENKPQLETKEKEAPNSHIVKENYQEVSRPNKQEHRNDDRYNERIYSKPLEEENQEYERDDRRDNIENQKSDEQSGEYRNYHEQPQSTHQRGSERNYHQNNKDNDDENYEVNKEEHGRAQSQELQDYRNGEERVYEPSGGKRTIELPQSRYHEIVNPENSQNREELHYSTPISKNNHYKIILSKPEVNTKIRTQHVIPETRNSKTSLPQGKSKTTTFYHRYTSKMEQPTRTTIYREENPEDDQINRAPYNEREKELKDLQNHYQEDNLQRENSRETIDEQRVKQLSYPENQQEETSQEGGEDSGQEGSYEEEIEEINNQRIPPRQYYREQERQVNPQRNVGIYIQQKLPQQRQIPVKIHPQFFYQRDRSENIRPHQKEILQRENSGEVVTREQLTQYRPESSTEDIFNQDKTAHYRTVPPQNLPQREYNIPNYQHDTRNLRGQVHIVSPRPHATQDNQYSTQHYSAKEYKNKKPIIYQPNSNVRETLPMIQHQINVQQQNHQPQYQQSNNNHGTYRPIPDPRLIHNEKNHQNVNIYKPHNEYTNIQQQPRPTNYRYHQVAPENMQQTRQPQHESVQKYDTRYHQHYVPQNTQFNHHKTSEQPRIHFVTRRQKRQTSNGLPLSSQFRSLLSRLYTPVGSPSSNHLNNFQNFISSSIPSSQTSETSRNPTQQRPTNYFPQQYHYNPRYQSPYNSDAQTVYDRSPVYSNPQFQQTPYYYQPPERPPLISYPNNFRYYDDSGEHLNQNIRNIPQRPTDGVASPSKPTTNAEQDDTSDKPAASIEQAEEPQQSDNSQNKKPIYPPLPTINPQNFPELKDFPFFNNPSYPYSQNGNDTSKDTENSQYSYNRIPPSRYHVPDLGVYFDPYGEFGVTPLYDASQTNSDDTKDSDSTESPTGKEQSEENEGKKEDNSRRRVPGKIKRPVNTFSNPPYDEKNRPDKPRGDLFITAPPQHPVSTYNPRSVNLFVTPPSYLLGQSRAPSVFGPEFFVPPLRPPLTTESPLKEIPEKHVTQQDNSLETSSEATTQTTPVQVTTPVQRQRGHRRRPQSTTRPKQGTRGTTRHPSASRSSSRHTSSERDSPRRLSESIRPLSEHSQPSRSTTRRPTSTRPPNRTPVRERPKPATLPPVRPTEKSSSESDSSDDGEPNPFRGSVPYGTRLRRPPPSRQTISKLSHERSSTVKKIEQSSASDRSFTIARKEPRERPHHIQSVERSHQPRRATNQLRETTPAPSSSTTYQTPPWTELRSRNIFRYFNEEGTTVGYSPNDDEDEQRVRRPSVRRATYIRKNQDLKPETKPKIFRGRTRVRNYHPRRGYTHSTQSTTTTSKAVTTPMPTTSTTKSPPPVIPIAVEAITSTSTTTTTPKPKATPETPKATSETTIVDTEPTPKLRVYTSRHGGSLRNERVINRLKDKPRLFTFGRPRGGTADDSNFDETNYATESSSES